MEKARKEKVRVEQQRKEFLAQKEKEAAEMRERIIEQKKKLEKEKEEQERQLAEDEKRLRAHEADLAKAELDQVEENLVDQVIEEEIEEFGESNIRSENEHDPALNQQPQLFNEEPLLRKSDRLYYTNEELEVALKPPLPKRDAWGEYGMPVILPSPDEKTKAEIDKGWERQGFNEYICDRISLHRQLGDKREKACREQRYRKPLPDNSVVIVFHNEAWCTLLRTVYSILHTTPKILLREIILVDDCSEIDKRPELGQKLEDYIRDEFDSVFGYGYVR